MERFHSNKLDSIRGIAILLVYFYHVMLLVFPGYEINNLSKINQLEVYDWKKIFLNLIPFGQGWIGVELFLVLSGFLIHFSYLKNGSKFDLMEFLSKRFWRIYPPYIITLLFFFIYKLNLSEDGIRSLVTHVFLIHNLNDKTFFYTNASYWTIALECQLYLLYPIFLFLSKYLEYKKTFALIVLVYTISTFLGFFLNISSISYNLSVLKFWAVWCSGAYLAHKYYNSEIIFNKPHLWTFFFYIIFIYFRYNGYVSHFVMIPVALMCLSFTEMVFYNKFIYKFNLSSFFMNAFSFIGTISYSIYLIHMYLIDELIGKFINYTSIINVNIFLSIFYSSIFIFLLSYSMHYLLELNSIKAGKYFRGK